MSLLRQRLLRSIRRSQCLVENVGFGCGRQPCQGLGSTPFPFASSLQSPCGPSMCLHDANFAVERLESCNASKPPDDSTANSKVEETSHRSIDGNDIREHQSIPLATQKSCAIDGIRGVSPLQKNHDTESETGFFGSSAVVENMTRVGVSQLQNGMPKALEDDCLVLDDFRVVQRVEETPYLENNLESSIRSNDGEGNAESLLHLDDVSSVWNSKSVESSQDAKIMQDICNLLESKGWVPSTEAFLNKHYALQLPHSIVAKVVLKQKMFALAKPFFEWACRQLGHDLHSCHALLLKLGENKLFDEMWELLNKMRDNGCQINKTTFCIMVKAYGAAGMPDMAVDVFRRFNNYGVTAGTHVFTSLLSMLFKLRLLGDARLCYSKMLMDGVKFDTHTFSTLIRGFGMMGCIRDAQTCFDVMLREGFEPDISTFNGIIEGFCCINAMEKALSTFSGLQKKGLKPNASTFNMIIKAFCQAGNLKDAFKLYTCMEKVCMPNQVTFNTLLRGLLANREICESITFFKLMQKEGWVDARSYVFLSNGLRQMKQTKEMLNLLRSLFDVHGFVNIEVCNSLIYNLSHMDKLDEAEKIFKGMATALESPSIPTYAIMISSYCRVGKLEEALELFTELKARGCRPSAFCYIPIISLMLKRDRVADALKWVEEMLELGLEVTSVTWDLLLKKLCRQGMVEKAKEVCDIIVEKRFTICVDTLFELMKCLCKLGDVEVAKACFRTMYKQHGLPKCKAVLQALAVMDKMAPICDEE